MEDSTKTNGVSNEILKCGVSEKHRHEVAKRIGDSWESLGTFIGVSSVDIDDLKEKYKEPLDRRLAMMRRWYELWGKEATYLRLVKGLRQVGRRDLIELIEQDLVPVTAAGSETKHSKIHVYDNESLFPWSAVKVKRWNIFFVGFFLIIFIGAIAFFKPNGVSMHESSSVSTIAGIEQDHGKNIAHHSKIVAFNHQTLSNCSFPETDLPLIHPLFVGRENDIHQVLHKVANAHIVNINGAPGFGKSTLAIHVGYKIFQNGTSVRYVNIEDKMFSILNFENQKQGSKVKVKPKFSRNTDVHPAQIKSLTKLSGSSLSLSSSQMLSSRSNGNLFDQLQKWSEAMKCTNVLILDNCDDILVGEYRHEFLNLINTLIRKSTFKLHIIVVSREKLLYLDDFDCWTVRELSQSESIQMVDKLAPAIDNETLTTVAELVEGCPLALKVIGQLLHIYGAQLIHRLKNEVISILDKVSLPQLRFRKIMDVAFTRLGVLKECGYVLSLFPGSFNERAGNVIVQKECLELYFKHSLLTEYSLADNYRYKMHRLIKEYLHEKISIKENTTFIAKFRKYFEALLLTHAKNQTVDKSDTEKYLLSLELHNFHYLKELLLIDKHLSSKELAVLGLLSNLGLLQFERLQGYYALYIKNVYEVCQLLNNLEFCGQMYTTVARYLYQKCKCETILAYFLNFFISPCMEYFQCKETRYLQFLYLTGKVHMSKDASSYIDIVVGSHCNKGYFYNYNIMRNYFGIEYIFISALAALMGPSSCILGRGVARHFCQSMFIDCIVVLIGMTVCITSACILFYNPVLLIYEIAIKNAHHLILRILEITLKHICQYAVLFLAITCVPFFMLPRLVPVAMSNSLTTFILLIMISFLLLMLISPAMSYYCCQFIPLCI